jgi:hypothetical protein
MWLHWQPRLYHGLVTQSASNEGTLAAASLERLDVFLRKGGWDDPLSTEGVPPLICAGLAGDAIVTGALIEAKADPMVHGIYRGRETLSTLGLVPRMHALLAAAAIGGDEATIATLLRARADPHLLAGQGGSALHAAAYTDNPKGVLALYRACQSEGVFLDLEQGFVINNATALSIAAYTGTASTVQALLSIGCNRLAVNDNGTNVLQASVSNPRTEMATFEELWGDGEGIDVNEQIRARTVLWQAISCVSRCTCLNVLLDYRHHEGSTLLHNAARLGRLDIVKWLLDHGAVHSLTLRSVYGQLPFDAASKNGIHAKVARALQTVHIQ